MSDWFRSSGVKGKWTAVQAGVQDGSADAAAFVEASLTIISIFDMISGMGTAKGDMVGNATTLQRAAASGGSLKALVEAELAGKSDTEVKKIVGDGKTATCALLWLVRALTFIKVMLELMVANPTMSMKDCVYKGYEGSLKPYHNMIVKGVFSAAVNMAPKREDFVLKLAGSEEDAMAAFKELLPIFTGLLDANRDYLKSKGIEK